MIIKSVDWTLLGCGIFGLLFLFSFMFPSVFMLGIAAGWAFCSIFWTYWIQHHGKKEGSTD